MISERKLYAPRHDLKVVAVVWLASFLFSNSLFSIHVALPAIQREFGGSLSAVQWIVLMGFVMSSSLSLCFGRVGDLWGRVRLFQIGIVVYTLGSVLCALAVSLPQLLAFRVPMTVGLAMATPMAPAILASTYPLGKRGQVLGWYASAFAVGRTTGPALGGILLYWDWRAIFLVNLVIGGLVSMATFKVLDVDKVRKSEPFDFLGAIFLMIGYPALLIALSLGPAVGWQSTSILFWFALSISGLLGFVVTELRAKKPLVRPSLFKNLPISGAMLALLLSSTALYPLFMYAPIYMRNVLGLSPFVLGLTMTAFPLLAAVSSPFSGYVGDRGSPKFVAALGLGLIFIGLMLYSSLGAQSTALAVGTALALSGVGSGFFIPANQKVAFAAIKAEDYGILSAMLISFGPAAGSIGTAFTTALIEATIAGGRSDNPISFARAQQFAFSWLLPFALIALLIALVPFTSRREPGRPPTR